MKYVSMKKKEKVLLIFFIIVLLLVSIKPGRIDSPLKIDWFKHFQILPKADKKAVLVTSPACKTMGTDSHCNKPSKINGIYLTSWKAGNAKFVDEIIDFAVKTKINAAVIDVKDDDGRISYSTSVPTALQFGAALPKFRPDELISKFEKNGICLIARIVVFKDSFSARNKSEWAVESVRGGLWHDRKGHYWLDPYNKAVWKYNLEIAKEAAQLGFKEIQFDYIRFASDGKIVDCRYPGKDTRSKSRVISDFLKYASDELQPYNVRVSADVFGLTCSAKDDLGIGQIFEEIASQVDVICPMVYPSHFNQGQYGIANPDMKPYDVVLKSLTDARQRLEAKGLKTIIRPWLQDFSLKSHYSHEQLKAQRRAVNDARLTEWLFWNPGNQYQVAKYQF